MKEEDSGDGDIAELEALVESIDEEGDETERRLRQYAELEGDRLQGCPGDEAGSQDDLKSRIASIFINRQLESFLLKHGTIPETPVESTIGVGFVDIVDYSYLSSWLSPRENQRLLNGLYSAFHFVLKKRGGYLNKISGDSLMFHFGGLIDPMVSDLTPEEAEPLIARILFLTCIEIQESCRLFNHADEEFIPKNVDPETRRELAQAFLIIRSLRENLSLVSSISNMFQVRIRIGASIGDVCVGNFGPEGAKQWDVIGVPVIEARRMESSAPVDGIRITEHLMKVLEGTGLVEQYLEYFKSRASGFYQGIRRAELFTLREVVLAEKKHVAFRSCAIQANPDLPEDVWREAESSLEKRDAGIETILDILKYYRGNRLVTHAMEELFREREIRLRKAEMFKFLLPARYGRLLAENGGNEAWVAEELERKTSLFQLFTLLGKFQDTLKSGKSEHGEDGHFDSWDEWIAMRRESVIDGYRERRKRREQYLYFEEVLFPGFFDMIEASLREYFARP